MKGFTVLEVMICVAIIGIFIAVLIPSVSGERPAVKDYTCKAGYKFTFDGVQILDENRGGIRCFDQ